MTTATRPAVSAAYQTLMADAGVYQPFEVPAIAKEGLVGVPFIITDIATQTRTSGEGAGRTYLKVSIMLQDGSEGVFFDGGAAIPPALENVSLPLAVPHGLSLGTNGKTWRLAA